LEVLLISNNLSSLYKYKISVVSFLNSIPFHLGLEKLKQNQNIELYFDKPSICAEKLKKNEVDIGLVPVAVLPKLSYYEIISDYVISSNNDVNTVLLLSNNHINEINTIYLDNDSKTSVQLVKVLASNFWKINVNYKNINITTDLNVESNEAVLAIGDKTFDLKDKFKYCYDLAQEWSNYTNFSFVFACWVANKPIDSEFKNEFNKNLAFGINNIELSVNQYNNIIDKEKAILYLKNNINYILNEKSRKGMSLFLDLIRRMD